MMTEDGQFYVIMECVYMGADYAPQTIEEAKLRYGESLLREKNESLKAYLYKEQRIAEGIYTQLSARNGQEAAVHDLCGPFHARLLTKAVNVPFRVNHDRVGLFMGSYGRIWIALILH